MKKVLVCLMALMASVYTWGTGEYTWDSSSKTLTINKAGDFASGETTDFTDVTKRGWKDYVSSAQHLIVADGITHLGAYTFYNCSTVVDVTLPASLVSIGHGAFFGCSKMSQVHFLGSPNEWASIDFRTNDSYRRSHPFYASTASSRSFYFYGNASASSIITLTYGITEVKAFAFYNATSIQGINIPGSVTTIRTNAFNVSSYSSAWVAINKKSAPSTVATDAFNTSVSLYVPTGRSGYTGTPWSSFNIYNQAVSGTCGTPTASDVAWSLSEDGTLTLTGHGAINIGTSGSGLSFARFRRLVSKLVVNGDASGEITDVDHAIHWCYGISEVEINQKSIPVSEHIATESSTDYAYLFNKRDNVVLKVKPAALVSASASNLDAAPWKNAKLSVALSETATFYERAENTDTLEAIKTYIDLPFSLQLKRTLSNAYYNTFCSPIPISAEQIVSTWGDDTYAHEFEGTEYDEEKDSLTLQFTEEIASIAAGVPYLIQPENNVANPTFTNVVPGTIVTEPETVTPDDAAASFVGTILSENVTEEWAEAENFIFLKADNKLTFATTGTLRGMRAYFLLDKDVSASALAKAPGLRIGHSEHIATATEHISHDAAHNASKIIRNGQLVIVRDGAEYNAQGIRIN